MKRKTILEQTREPIVFSEDKLEQIKKRRRHDSRTAFLKVHAVNIEGIDHVYADAYTIDTDELDENLTEPQLPTIRWATDGDTQFIYEFTTEKNRYGYLGSAISQVNIQADYSNNQWEFSQAVLGVECEEEAAVILNGWYKEKYSKYVYCYDTKDPKALVMYVNEGIVTEKKRKAAENKSVWMKKKRAQLNDYEIKEALARNGRYGLEHDYLLYKQSKGKGKAFCTACGKNWEYTQQTEYPYSIGEWHKMNQVSKCPECGEKVIEKPAGKYKRISERMDMIYVQRTETGIAVRYLECWRNIEWDSFLNMGRQLWKFADQKVFYLDEYAEGRHSRFTEDKNCQIIHKKPGVLLYCDNLKEATKGTIWERVDLSVFAKDIKYWDETFAYAVNNLRYPAYETLFKCGYMRILYDSCWNYRKPSIDASAIRLHDVLKISRDQLRRFQGIDLTDTQLRYIQIENIYGKLTKELLLEATRYSEETMHKILAFTGNYVRTLNYLRKPNTTIYQWLDLLEMEEAAGCDMKDDINLYPRDCRATHQLYVNSKNAEKAAVLNKQLKHIAEIEEMVNELMAYENDMMLIRAPHCAAEIQTEGQTLHHCVYANKYHEKMAREETFILFLRKKSAPEKPYYTLEVSPDGRLRQWYGEYDRRPDIEVVRPFIESYIKHIAKIHWKTTKNAA